MILSVMSAARAGVASDTVTGARMLSDGDTTYGHSTAFIVTRCLVTPPDYSIERCQKTGLMKKDKRDPFIVFSPSHEGIFPSVRSEYLILLELQIRGLTRRGPTAQWTQILQCYSPRTFDPT